MLSPQLHNQQSFARLAVKVELLYSTFALTGQGEETEQNSY